jgi:dTDP-4-amino-4,6-dideoxygalactose transaminase
MAGGPFEILGELPTATRLAASEVSLPVHAYLREDEVSQVVEACNAWAG